MTHNIYLLTQSEFVVKDGYDVHDSMVVVAESAQQARRIYPAYDNKIRLFPDWHWEHRPCPWTSWASHPDRVTAKFIGKAPTRTACPSIILKSFNAG